MDPGQAHVKGVMGCTKIILDDHKENAKQAFQFKTMNKTSSEGICKQTSIEYNHISQTSRKFILDYHVRKNERELTG